MASDRLSRFADALLEEADEKKKQVEKELNDKKQHQLDQIDKNLNEYFNSSVNTGKYKLDHQKQIYLTRRETDLRRILLQNRQKNFNYIFDEAKRNIEQFTQTPAYHEKLKRDFAEASVLFTKCEGAVVCKVMEKDIELAKKLLLQETFVSVKDVALKCGFVDSFYFSTLFRKKTGLSPSAYQKAGGGKK